MKRLPTFTTGLLLIGCAVVGNLPIASGQSPWVTLLDGRNMGDWNVLGDANWRLEDGAVVTDKGRGFLVTKKSYKDFQIRAEIWVTPESNTGIHIRNQDPNKPSSKAGYEVNINDQRKGGLEYGTGAIVNVAKVEPNKYLAGNRWNLLDITARGPHLVVLLNDIKTADVQHDASRKAHSRCRAGAALSSSARWKCGSFDTTRPGLLNWCDRKPTWECDWDPNARAMTRPLQYAWRK